MLNISRLVRLSVNVDEVQHHVLPVGQTTTTLRHVCYGFKSAWARSRKNLPIKVTSPWLSLTESVVVWPVATGRFTMQRSKTWQFDSQAGPSKFGIPLFLSIAILLRLHATFQWLGVTILSLTTIRMHAGQTDHLLSSIGFAEDPPW